MSSGSKYKLCRNLNNIVSLVFALALDPHNNYDRTVHTYIQADHMLGPAGPKTDISNENSKRFLNAHFTFSTVNVKCTQ